MMTRSQKKKKITQNLKKWDDRKKKVLKNTLRHLWLFFFANMDASKKGKWAEMITTIFKHTFLLLWFLFSLLLLLIISPFYKGIAKYRLNSL